MLESPILLSKKQRQILEFIQREIRLNGFAPSYQEIAAHIGIHTVSTVHKHVSALVKSGVISKGRNAKRQFQLNTTEQGAVEGIQLLGAIAAGAPIENFATPETLDLPAFFKSPRPVFALKVRGDSMIEAGIHDGDTVIIEERSEARNGEIVVALIEEREATLKEIRWLNQGREVELTPANATLKPKTYPADKIKIQGVLRGVLRVYPN